MRIAVVLGKHLLTRFMRCEMSCRVPVLEQNVNLSKNEGRRESSEQGPCEGR
jgi:hypothetical protein